MRAALFTLATASILGTTTAQNYVPTPQGLKTVISKNYPGASISYKATKGLCETTPGVKSYSGYVHLPETLLADVPAAGYNASIFFWYFGMLRTPSRRTSRSDLTSQQKQETPHTKPPYQST